MTALFDSDGFGSRENVEDPIRCLDAGQDDCQGPVQYHSTDPGARPAFPRCDFHWLRRLDREAETRRKYGTEGSIPPADFDPAYAGERWDEE